MTKVMTGIMMMTGPDDYDSGEGAPHDLGIRRRGRERKGEEGRAKGKGEVVPRPDNRT